MKRSKNSIVLNLVLLVLLFFVAYHCFDIFVRNNKVITVFVDNKQVYKGIQAGVTIKAGLNGKTVVAVHDKLLYLCPNGNYTGDSVLIEGGN